METEVIGGLDVDVRWGQGEGRWTEIAVEESAGEEGEGREVEKGIGRGTGEVKGIGGDGKGEEWREKRGLEKVDGRRRGKGRKVFYMEGFEVWELGYDGLEGFIEFWR